MVIEDKAQLTIWFHPALGEFNQAGRLSRETADVAVGAFACSVRRRPSRRGDIERPLKASKSLAKQIGAFKS